MMEKGGAEPKRCKVIKEENDEDNGTSGDTGPDEVEETRNNNYFTPGLTVRF